MKKLKSKKIKSLRSTSKVRIFSLLAVVVIVASAGLYTLLSSSADSVTGTISIILKDKATGKPIPAGEGYVSLSITTPGTLCSNMEGLTNTDGQINFNGCRLGILYNVTFITFKQGWYQVAPGSPLTYNNQVSVPPGVQTSIYFVTTTPVDSDGDGVPNKTDTACPNAAGPASNNGCPVPAATPSPSPAPSAPAPSTSTTTKPPASSSTSTKKTTTSPKPAAAATAPAVVVATSGDTVPPSAPENLSINQQDDSLFLSWDESSDNVGVTGYNIDRSTDGETWQTLETNLSDSFYTDNDLGAVEKYFYRVQALDGAGNKSEGALGDIQINSSKTSSSSNKPKTASPANKKSSAGLVAGLGIGVVFVLAAIIGVFIFMRRRMLGPSNPYSYDTSNMTQANIPAATVMPSNTPLPQQQPNVSSQPIYNVGPPAQHTSVSLKDMVIEDMSHHGTNPQSPPAQQAQPPLPPSPFPQQQPYPPQQPPQPPAQPH